LNPVTEHDIGDNNKKVSPTMSIKRTNTLCHPEGSSVIKRQSHITPPNVKESPGLNNAVPAQESLQDGHSLKAVHIPEIQEPDAISEASNTTKVKNRRSEDVRRKRRSPLTKSAVERKFEFPPGFFDHIKDRWSNSRQTISSVASSRFSGPELSPPLPSEVNWVLSPIGTDQNKFSESAFSSAETLRDTFIEEFDISWEGDTKDQSTQTHECSEATPSSTETLRDIPIEEYNISGKEGTEDQFMQSYECWRRYLGRNLQTPSESQLFSKAGDQMFHLLFQTMDNSLLKRWSCHGGTRKWTKAQFAKTDQNDHTVLMAWIIYRKKEVLTSKRYQIFNEAFFLDLILQGGASLDQENSRGETAIDIAIQHGQLDAVKFLRSRNANHGSNPSPTEVFAWVINVDSMEAKASLLNLKKAGANLNCTNSNGETPLNIAMKVGNVGAFRLLFDHGANMHTVTGAGHGLIEYAKPCFRYTNQDNDLYGRIKICKTIALEHGVPRVSRTQFGKLDNQPSSRSQHSQRLRRVGTFQRFANCARNSSSSQRSSPSHGLAIAESERTVGDSSHHSNPSSLNGLDENRPDSVLKSAESPLSRVSDLDTWQHQEEKSAGLHSIDGISVQETEVEIDKSSIVGVDGDDAGIGMDFFDWEKWQADN
jgi:hypothetical protein